MLPWILALIALCAPPEAKSAADAPAVFEDIARAIDIAAHERPLYTTHDAVERTVAELVAVAARESHFIPSAMAEDWAGVSFGLFQIHETNFPRLGISWREAIEPVSAAPAALKLLAESHRVCRALPLEDQLSEYASGQGRCDTPEGLRDSANRMRLVERLLREPGPRWVDRSPPLSKHAAEPAAIGQP